MTTGGDGRRRPWTTVTLVGAWIAVAVFRSVTVVGEHGSAVAVTVGVSALVLFGLPLLAGLVVQTVKPPNQKEPDAD